MTHDTQNHLDAIASSTQPVVYGVAGLHILGITIQDWIVVGTAALLIMNLCIGTYKVWTLWRNKHG